MSTGAAAINCRMPQVGIWTQEVLRPKQKVRDRTYCSSKDKYQQQYN